MRWWLQISNDVEKNVPESWKNGEQDHIEQLKKNLINHISITIVSLAQRSHLGDVGILYDYVLISHYEFRNVGRLKDGC